jgi:hypothetical protein
MRTPVSALVLLLVPCLAACSAEAGSHTPRAPRLGFDETPPGELAAGWQAASTRPEGPTASWSVVADAGAPSAPHALALTAPNHTSGRTFNLCWKREPTFQDGELEVSLRSISGEIDQGGGLAWRIQGPDDYYVCRYNPLERNFRVYVVRAGERRQLASAEVDPPASAWSRMRVEHTGARIACWLDGERLLDAQDATIPAAGGVGLWTKADACTAFDDLTVRAR